MPLGQFEGFGLIFGTLGFDFGTVSPPSAHVTVNFRYFLAYLGFQVVLFSPSASSPSSFSFLMASRRETGSSRA